MTAIPNRTGIDGIGTNRGGGKSSAGQPRPKGQGNSESHELGRQDDDRDEMMSPQEANEPRDQKPRIRLSQLSHGAG